MTPLFLLSVIPAFLGLWLGWRGHQRWPTLFAQALAATLLYLLALLLAFGERPQSLNARSILTAVPYLVLPYFTFLLAPCLIAAAIGKALHKPNSKPPTDRQHPPEIQ